MIVHDAAKKPGPIEADKVNSEGEPTYIPLDQTYKEKHFNMGPANNNEHTTDLTSKADEAAGESITENSTESINLDNSETDDEMVNNETYKFNSKHSVHSRERRKEGRTHYTDIFLCIIIKCCYIIMFTYFRLNFQTTHESYP